MLERGTNMWMKISRGDISDRFDKIRETYLSVTKETKNQIEREGKILDAYRDYRGALKHAEVMALEVLKKAGEKLEAVKGDLKRATDAVATFSGKEPAERAKLELARDEQLRLTQDDSLMQLGYGVRQKRLDGTLTDDSSAVAARVSLDRRLAGELLRAVEVPIPESRFADSADAPWGRIVPGASADLVLLARDPRGIDPHELPGVEVRETYLAGEPRLAPSVAEAAAGTPAGTAAGTPAHPDPSTSVERSVALHP